jgi:hypothetical protein
MSLISGNSIYWNHKMSCIFGSKEWAHDPSYEQVYFCHGIGLQYGLPSLQTI